jgi:hypothetical protein
MRVVQSFQLVMLDQVYGSRHDFLSVISSEAW